VAVTSATVVIYGQAIWDPVALLARVGEGQPLVVILSMLGLAIATLSTNLAANVVSPANDISNLAPRHISFKMGGVITGIIGILMMPWKLTADPTGYVFIWLGGYGTLLGAVGGVLIGEYWILRKTQLSLPDLYRPGGVYPAWNGVALVALAAGILPCAPGFLHTVGWMQAPSAWQALYPYSIFVSFLVALVVHVGLSRLLRGQALAAQPTA
jgi:NCS1 family nucleobase:cation symporter-1